MVERNLRGGAYREVHSPSLRTFMMEMTMRKIILTVVGAVLLAAPAVNMAAASEHHMGKTVRTQSRASQQFQNANNSANSSALSGGYGAPGPGGYNTGR
jgi:hypothetical protein